jgi:DNA topoisomerase-6 subunit B
LRLALQTVGRQLGTYMKRREKVKREGERRSIFLRYLGEVATAVSSVNKMDRQELYDALLMVAKQKTSTADVILGEDGKPMDVEDNFGENFGENVIVVA